MDGQNEQWMTEQTYTLTWRREKERTDRLADGQMHEGTDGQAHQWTDPQMDGNKWWSNTIKKNLKKCTYTI